MGADLVKNGYANDTVYRGKDVLICVIDTGIDWTHLDFRRPDDPLGLEEADGCLPKMIKNCRMRVIVVED